MVDLGRPNAEATAYLEIAMLITVYRDKLENELKKHNSGLDLIQRIRPLVSVMDTLGIVTALQSSFLELQIILYWIEILIVGRGGRQEHVPVL